MRPEPAPPFHHTSLPDDPEPARKLHTVRFSMLTLSVFHTTMPLRPMGLPSEPVSPKSCSAAVALHGVEVLGLVPSTMVVVRFMPRRWRPELVMTTPP